MKKTLIGLAAAALMVPASAMAERDGATVYKSLATCVFINSLG